MKAVPLIWFACLEMNKKEREKCEFGISQGRKSSWFNEIIQGAYETSKVNEIILSQKLTL